MRRRGPRDEGLVALKDLSDRLHRIIVEIILLDFRRVEARVGFNLDHVTAIAGTRSNPCRRDRT